ncbi:MAG: hypothetical protein KC586_28005 [Myxococcales bacterium]|nr:hypothetical protein [Myxococcales bacterium]
MLRLRLALSLLLALTFVACGDDAEGGEAVSTEPTVGLMELALSNRHDAAPANAADIEISGSAIRLDGRDVLALEGGRVPEAERDGTRVPKLSEALAGAPGRRAATLRIYASTPYQTTALVLGTLKAANVAEVAFAVRRGATTDLGYLKIDGYDVREESSEPATVPATHQRQWAELAPVWESMTEACTASEHKVDCAYKPSTIAEGGDLQITFFARGSAVKLELERVRGVDAPPPSQPALLEGIEADPTQPIAEPAKNAAFMWRFQAATQAESPLAATMRPLCGAQPCGGVVTAEGQTQTMTVLSFLGATFPNGTPAPYVVFQIPPR